MLKPIEQTRSFPTILILSLLLGTGISPFTAPFSPASLAAQGETVRDQKDDESRQEETKRQSTIRMEEINIMGEIEKPKTMFVIPRAPHAYYREESKKDFSEEILTPIDIRGIEDIRRWRENSPLPQD